MSTARIPGFQINYLKTVTRWTIEDIATVDCRMRDGIGVTGALDLLADNFSRLTDDAVSPPGISRSDYRARAGTLASFAQQAADEVHAGDESDGYARYSVVRDEAKPLLRMINRSLGTQFKYAYLASC